MKESSLAAPQQEVVGEGSKTGKNTASLLSFSPISNADSWDQHLEILQAKHVQWLTQESHPFLPHPFCNPMHAYREVSPTEVCVYRIS